MIIHHYSYHSCASMTPAITRFRGEYAFLSNFYPVSITVGDGEGDGETYPTLEHAYQALKTTDLAERLTIRLATSPGRAKRLGRHMTLRPGWDNMRLLVMGDLLQRKFERPDLRQRLLATGDAELVETNDWHDTFWGVCNGVGENWLGVLLMGLRAQLRDTGGQE